MRNPYVALAWSTATGWQQPILAESCEILVRSLLIAGEWRADLPHLERFLVFTDAIPLCIAFHRRRAAGAPARSAHVRFVRFLTH